MDHPDEREYTRTSAKTEIEVLCEDREPIRATTQNLSVSGLFAACTPRLPVGTACTVRVLRDAPTDVAGLEATGRVIRVADDGMAIELIEMSLESYERMRNLVLYQAVDRDGAAVVEELGTHIDRLRDD